MKPSPKKMDRVLGRWDLVLFFVVAVANLNIVPAIAASGAVTVWLWPLAILGFFVPQGVAVMELSQKWPGEGGIYQWARHSFGAKHGFFAGWFYWMSVMFYIPTVLLSAIGVGVYMLGGRGESLAQSHIFTACSAVVLIVALLAVNIRGLQLGKWVNTLGGIGTIAGAVAVVALALATVTHSGSALHLHDLKPDLSRSAMFTWIGIFGTICYGLQGLDIASLMGDEIEEPRKVLPSAILLGGILSALIYIGVTLSMLVATPKDQIGVLSGVLQAINQMATRSDTGFVVMPLAVLECIALIGVASAWFSSTSRLPFVCGLDRYLPSIMGRLHPRYHTPYVSLIVYAVIACVLIAVSYLQASVGEAYMTMVQAAVVFQMIPNCYMFAALLRLAKRSEVNHPACVTTAAIAGLVSCAVALVVAFLPAPGTVSVIGYESKMIIALLLVLGVAVALYVRAEIVEEIN